MIDLTDKELRQIDLEFRTRAGRVMRVQFRDVVGTIRQFLDYVESVPLLRDYVESCKLPIPETELLADIKGVAESYGRAQFHFDSTTEGEVAQAYYILKHCAGGGDVCEKRELIMSIGHAYNSSGDTGYQCYVEAFVNSIAQRFIEDITLYLHSLTMNIKTDVERAYHIENNGGQVVIANDHSAVTASQNNVSERNRFVLLKDSVISAARDAKASDAQIAEIRDILAEIEKHISGPSPRKSLLGAFFAGLEKVAGAVANGALLVEKVKDFAEYVLSAYKGLIQ